MSNAVYLVKTTVMYEINVKMFQFIERLRPATLPVSPPSLPEMKGGESVIDLGPVQGLSLSTRDPVDNTYASKYVNVNGKMLGLNEDDFKELKELLAPLLNIAPFDKFADLNFLIESAFDWLVEVRRHFKADAEFINYLRDRLNSSINEYTYYFRVRSILIEDSFPICDGYIGIFSEEDISQCYLAFSSAKPGTSQQEFRKLFDSHFTGVHARINVKGIPGKSESIAKRKAELIIDVLKCFCSKWSIQRNYNILELDFRENAKGFGNFMCVPNTSFANAALLLRNSERILPIEITNTALKEFEKLGLLEFSSFVQCQPKSEIADVIYDSIRLLSQIMSVINPYEKVVKIISFIENIVVRKEGGGKAKGLTKVKIVIPRVISNTSDVDKITKAFAVAYNVRDKYLHNYIELPLDIDTLFYTLEFCRAIILKLIRLSEKRELLVEIYDFFGLE